MEKIDLAKKEKSSYAFSEKMYVIECAFAYFITIATSGAYLAKLTTTIGISDSMTAILSNINSLACIFQLLSIPLSHKKTLKGSVISTMLISHLLLGLLYLIPFFGSGITSVLFFLCILFSCIFLQIGAPLKLAWFVSLPSPERKGSFQATVQMFSHATGLAFSFTASWLMDYFTESGQTEAMFITFTAIILTLSVLNFLTLFVSREKPRPPVPRRSLLRDVKEILKQPGFPSYIIMNTLYVIALTTTSAFLGTYMIKELGLSMIKITVLNAINAVVAIFFLAFFGNFSRRHGLAKCIMTGFPLFAISYLFITFTSQSNGFVLMLLYYVINTLGSAGLVVGLEPILFDAVSEEYRVSALSLKNVIAGLAAFLGTLALTPLMNYIQSSGNSFLGIKIYAQQLFAIISCVLLFTSMLIFSFFIKKVKSGK